MIRRLIEQHIVKKLSDKKAILLFGPRQVGKTTLINELLESKNALFLSGDDAHDVALLQNQSIAHYKKTFAKTKIIVIDEAQRIENIGLKIKLIVDNIPNLKVVATGSSAYELANKIKEPLTGRKWEYQLFPFSFEEMVQEHGLLEEQKLLHTRLLYGYYPEVVTNAGDEHQILKSLTDSFLYKDILQWEGIQKPDKLIMLLKALALQVGNLVSYNELSQIVGLDRKTIEKYVDLLEKVFVIFKLHSFSRNLRNELNKSFKIYFYDNGIRNALLNAFQPIATRNDIGPLWENFIISEKIKFNHYHSISANYYFWRTLAQQEIDWIEERSGILYVSEIKWNPAAKAKPSITFQKAYPNFEFSLVHSQNYFEVLLP